MNILTLAARTWGVDFQIICPYGQAENLENFQYLLTIISWFSSELLIIGLLVRMDKLM